MESTSRTSPHNTHSVPRLSRGFNRREARPHPIREFTEVNFKRKSKSRMRIYDQLVNSPYPADPSNLASTISNVGVEHGEIIYALILHHYTITSGSFPLRPPYKGTKVTSTKGIMYDLENLPPELICVISGYIDLIMSQESDF